VGEFGDKVESMKSLGVFFGLLTEFIPLEILIQDLGRAPGLRSRRVGISACRYCRCYSHGERDMQRNLGWEVVNKSHGYLVIFGGEEFSVDKSLTR